MKEIVIEKTVALDISLQLKFLIMAIEIKKTRFKK
jgi:hypothetical protein